MTYTPIPFGTTNWHVPVNAAFTDQDARITTAEEQLAATPAIGETVPQDHNAIAWTSDPGHAVGVSTPTLGVLTMIRLAVREDTTLTSVAYTVATAGVALTAGGNWIGLYDASGTLVATAPSQQTNYGTVGMHTVNWDAPFAATAGFYWVAFLTNGTTGPALARGAVWSVGTQAQSSASLNIGLTETTARAATFGSGLAPLPTPIDMSTRTLNNVNYWAVLL